MSETVLSQVFPLARAARWRLTFLHVVQPSRHGSGTRVLPGPVDWEFARVEAESYLDSVRRRAQRQGLDVDTLLFDGDANTVIQETVAREEFEMVALSSRGESGRGCDPPGTTARSVLDTAGAPVLLVPPMAARGAERTQTDPRRILVPLDGSARAECVLSWVRRFAARSDTEVLIFHGLSTPALEWARELKAECASLWHELVQAQETHGKRYLEDLVEHLRAEGIRARSVMRQSADVAEAALEVASSEDCDLAVVSAHGSGCAVARPFGSVAAAILQHASVPLFVVRDDACAERSRERAGDDLRRQPLRRSGPRFSP